MVKGLRAPKNLRIDFAPSARQFEVWKNLQPECPECGGEIVQQQNGIDRNGNPTYEPVCSKCGLLDIPQMILSGGAAGGAHGPHASSALGRPAPEGGRRPGGVHPPQGADARRE